MPEQDIQPERKGTETGGGITLGDLLRAIFVPASVEAATPQTDVAEDAPEAEAAPAAPSAVRTLAPPAPAQTPDFVRQTAAISPETTVTLFGGGETDPGADLVAESDASPHRLALVAGTLGALLLGYLAQSSLNAGGRGTLGLILYLLVALEWLAVLYLEFGTSEDRWAWLPKRPRPAIIEPPQKLSLGERLLAIEPPRLYLAAAGIVLCALTYLTTANNHLSLLSVVTWWGSVALWVIVLSEHSGPPRLAFVERFTTWLRRPSLTLRLEPYGFLALAVIALAVFFRFYGLDALPGEMTSDHVEKLLDAYDVQNGMPSVFFPRNGGREAIQMYLVALAADVFGTGMSFMSLKLVTAIEGLLLIPALLRLGRELFDRETALFAALLVAVSWWHASLSRMGLRIVLTPLVVTLVLTALLRGLRSGQRKHFIATGLWLGVGVYSYQAMRMMPLVVIVGVVLSMFTPDRPPGWRRKMTFNLIVAGLLALIIFVPMLRFWVDAPDAMWARVVTRSTAAERSLDGSALALFANNFGRALLMYNYRGDVAWISAVPNAPLLDLVSGFLFVLGLVTWGVRLVVRRNPLDGLIPLAILIMMLPSALAIAFPIENPSATRASGVIPMVYLLAAWPLTLTWRRWRAALPGAGKRLGWVVIIILALSATLFNYRTYFTRYAISYHYSALNPSEVGEAMRGFVETGGSLDNVYLQGYPFWHDYRAMGIEAGDITWHNAILDVDDLQARMVSNPNFFNASAKLFVVHPDDIEAQDVLQEAYPEGQLVLKTSAMPGKSFYLFVVPATPEDYTDDDVPLEPTLPDDPS